MKANKREAGSIGEMRHIAGELGEIYIADRAIAQICARVVQEQEGLRTPDQVRAGGGLLGAISKAVKGSGIEVLKNEGGLVVKMSLLAEYGVRINEAAQRLIRETKDRVRELASLEIQDVFVEITGVYGGRTSSSGK